MFANLHTSALIFIASLIPFVRGNRKNRKVGQGKKKPALVVRFECVRNRRGGGGRVRQPGAGGGGGGEERGHL